MSGEQMPTFVCAHGKGWPEEEWSYITPDALDAPRQEHVDAAKQSAEVLRESAIHEDGRGELVVNGGPGLASGLRAEAAAREFEATSHRQIRCPVCGFTERIHAQDLHSLTAWAAAESMPVIPLRSLRKLLRQLGIE